jgi:nicotinamide-nucleotide amidase
MSEIDEVAEGIARRLVERGETIAVAESSAAGLISAALLGVSGASRYYRAGVVFYNAPGIEKLIGLTPDELAKHRSATAPRAAMIARAIRERLDATWAIAETGAAGPTGNRYGDAAGHTALAVAGPVERTEVVETGDSDRRRNMDAFALAALRLLTAALDSA